MISDTGKIEVAIRHAAIEEHGYCKECGASPRNVKGYITCPICKGERYYYISDNGHINTYHKDPDIKCISFIQ